MAKVMRVESGDDRINALPDELLCHIISFLPTKTAVCTSLLSKRWRCLYTSISSIDIFIDTPSSPSNPNWFTNFVDRVLFSPEKPSIQRFCLKWHHNVDTLGIHRWIDNLMCHGIQELELCNLHLSPCRLQIPSTLFYSETLVTLKLDLSQFKGFYLEVPDGAFLPNLKVLHINNCNIEGGCTVDDLLSCCPVLEDFALKMCLPSVGTRYWKVNVFKNTLKRLTLSFWHRIGVLEVVVDCSALEYLNYGLVGDGQSLALINCPALVEVVMGGYSLRVSTGYPTEHKDYVLKKISGIQSLEILDSTLHGMYSLKLGLPLFNKLTYLKIHDWIFLFDPRRLEYLLANCVVLETLIVEEHRRSPYSSKKIRDKNDFVCLDGLLCHLKIIKFHLREIEDGEADSLMKIFKFFINNGEVLEDLTVLLRDFPTKQQLEIAKELSILPSASKKCRVLVDKWSS